MTARPGKLNDTQTILYEIDMLNYSVKRIVELGDRQSFDLNAHLECFLLHFRNLIEFLGRPNPRGDDLHISKPDDFWRDPQKRPSADRLEDLNRRGTKLWERYEDGDAKKDRISKYLHHCTKSRTDAKDWEVGTMYDEIRELLSSFLDLIPDKTRPWNEQAEVRVVGPLSNSTATVI